MSSPSAQTLFRPLPTNSPFHREETEGNVTASPDPVAQQPEPSSNNSNSNSNHNSNSNSNSNSESNPETAGGENTNLHNTTPVAPLLIPGRRLPQLSPLSNIPYLKNKTRRKHTTFYSLSAVPSVLLDLNAKEWMDTAFLRKHFKARGRNIIAYPYCLLVQAKTITDRMIVINWWLNQRETDMAKHWETLKLMYTRPRRSASPVGWRSQMKQEEKARIKAEEDAKHRKAWEEMQKIKELKKVKERAEKEAAVRTLQAVQNARRNVIDEMTNILETTGAAGGEEWVPMYFGNETMVCASNAKANWFLKNEDLDTLENDSSECKRYMRYRLRDVIECAEEKHGPEVLKNKIFGKSNFLEIMHQYGSYLKHKFDTNNHPSDMIVEIAAEMKPVLDAALEESEEKLRAAQQEYAARFGMVRSFEQLTQNLDPTRIEELAPQKKRGRKPKKKEGEEDVELLVVPESVHVPKVLGIGIQHGKPHKRVEPTDSAPDDNH